MTAALVLAASIFVPTQAQAATTVTSSTTTWAANFEDSDPFDYVVNSDTTINGRVTVEPYEQINLTIAEGATLTVTGGISLAQQSQLYVKGKGKLIAGVSGSIASGYPGIGNDPNETDDDRKGGASETVSFDDGITVIAQGGAGAPGIGMVSSGLSDGGNGVGITLGNCNVTATGGSGASGIGTTGAASSKPFISVEDFDGTLTATGGASGAIVLNPANIDIQLKGVSVKVGSTKKAAADRVSALSTANATVVLEKCDHAGQEAELGTSKTCDYCGGTIAALTSATVTFDGNGGTPATQSKTITSAQAVSPDTEPTKDGYTLAGWTLNGADYNLSTTVKKDITLVAKWTANAPTTYTVTFNSNGGSNVSSKTVTAGGTVTKPTDPTKSGYTFAGWRKSGASSNYNFSTPVTENITLVAQWTQNASGTGTNTGTELPNTDSLDARGVYATVLILSALCAGGAFLVRRRYRKG